MNWPHRLGMETEAGATMRARLAVYRESLHWLVLYEPVVGRLRAGAASLVMLAVPALPAAAAYATVYVEAPRAGRWALALTLAAAISAAGRIVTRRLWERPVVGRLEAWRESNPLQGEVPVLVSETEGRRAREAIARARLHPKYWRRHIAVEADKAPRFWQHIAVVQPLLGKPQVELVRVAERTCDALRDAGIPARVLGWDVLGGVDGASTAAGTAENAEITLAPPAE